MATLSTSTRQPSGSRGTSDDLRAREARQLVECLVRRPEDDDVVPRLEHGGEEDPDRLVGAGEDDDLARINPPVELWLSRCVA